MTFLFGVWEAVLRDLRLRLGEAFIFILPRKTPF